MKKLIIPFIVIGLTILWVVGCENAKNKSKMFLLKPVFNFEQECIRSGGEWGATIKDGYKIDCCFTKNETN